MGVRPDAPGSLPPVIGPEVEEFLTWLSVVRGRAPNTVAAYRRDLRAFESWLGGLSVPEATVETVEDYIGHLRELGRAPASVARAAVAVRSLYRYLALEGGNTADSLGDLEVPKVPRGLPRALTEPQVEALLASPTGSEPSGLRDRAILEVLYGTGIRVSELVGLSLSDVDLRSRLTKVMGKGRRERIVPLGRMAQEALGNWLSGAGRPAMEPARWRSREDSEAVFLSARGTRLTRQGVWLVVRRHGTRAGIARELLSPHVLRHSCATHMLDHGADIRTVQELLGHASISSTQRYTGVSQVRLRSVYDRAHPRASVAS